MLKTGTLSQSGVKVCDYFHANYPLICWLILRLSRGNTKANKEKVPNKIIGKGPNLNTSPRLVTAKNRTTSIPQIPIKKSVRSSTE